MTPILDKYRKNAHAALVVLRDNATQELQNGAHFRRSTYGGTHYIPAVTCEEIAMVAIEKSARVRALNEAIDAVNDAYKRLFEKDDHDGDD